MGDTCAAIMAAMVAIVNNPKADPVARATAGRAVGQLLALGLAQNEGQPRGSTELPRLTLARPARQRRRVVPFQGFVGQGDPAAPIPGRHDLLLLDHPIHSLSWIDYI